jgi:uncharacterized DUF497 family protein
MQDEFFEWDDPKAAANERDHGITFPPKYRTKSLTD